ncbi:hypothetical protein PHET_05598 [Paragonimus heterotremus]|uniref:Uncharacterized protein n=1 Tax=Paragonimus heterotremus TaxID=100268 RepID=A0A8J4TGK1_9TREM|nr:hypothetical protein PHET_05598 [Paragonimus heterotremus]
MLVCLPDCDGRLNSANYLKVLGHAIMGDTSVNESVDDYEHYNYEDDKIAGFKGGKHRTKTELEDHHKKGDNRTNRVHVDKQVNNEEKQREQKLKHSSESKS